MPISNSKRHEVALYEERQETHRQALGHPTKAELLKAGLLYKSTLGWNTIPLSGKTPLVPKWTEYSTKTQSETELTELLGRFPNATGIGFVIPPDILVVDVDIRSGGEVSLIKLQENIGELPVTPQQITGGGGSHYLFTLPKGTPHIPAGGSLTEQGYPGIEWKTAGGQIVLSPSIHPITQKRYRWEISAHPLDIPIREIPAPLLGLVLSASGGDREGQPQEKSNGTAPPRWTDQEIVGFFRKVYAEGTRRTPTGLPRLIGILKARNVPHDDALEFLCTWTETYFQPPMSEKGWKEFRKTFDYAWGHYKGPSPGWTEEDGREYVQWLKPLTDNPSLPITNFEKSYFPDPPDDPHDTPSPEDLSEQVKVCEALFHSWFIPPCKLLRATYGSVLTYYLSKNKTQLIEVLLAQGKTAEAEKVKSCFEIFCAWRCNNLGEWFAKRFHCGYRNCPVCALATLGTFVEEKKAIFDAAGPLGVYRISIGAQRLKDFSADSGDYLRGLYGEIRGVLSRLGDKARKDARDQKWGLSIAIHNVYAFRVMAVEDAYVFELVILGEKDPGAAAMFEEQFSAELGIHCRVIEEEVADNHEAIEAFKALAAMSFQWETPEQYELWAHATKGMKLIQGRGKFSGVSGGAKIDVAAKRKAVLKKEFDSGKIDEATFNKGVEKIASKKLWCPVCGNCRPTRGPLLFDLKRGDLVPTVSEFTGMGYPVVNEEVVERCRFPT